MARPERTTGIRAGVALLAGVLLLGACAGTTAFAAGAKQAGAKQRDDSVRADEALDKARLAIREKDFDGAMRELDALSKRGNVHAMYLLAALLLATPAGEPDPARALPLLEKSAAAGVPRAASGWFTSAATA